MSLDEKKRVRNLVLARRGALTERERQEKSLHIEKQVLTLPEYEKAQTVMLFLNFRDEVETTALAEETLTRGKQLVLPRCAPQGILIPALIRDLDQDIEPGTWGIREPRLQGLREADPWAIDLVIVPGAAFDGQGNRLGYGGGYYDRFFGRLRPQVLRVAIAFATQVLPEVPVDPHDQKMSILVTEEGVHRY
ncbi:MAG: 5-formyltetrahydrofolate cyclo-ligase [Desulfitobacteriaceae bacterium]|nr:5-formyltetrahydrofolate cyclo-ligase [Desulfitobacteriaceae bacterium]MDI6913037.1 5-formyltetrahydrofolate cyclo-ligase [Desulfitobacteriaceae bacterium]